MLLQRLRQEQALKFLFPACFLDLKHFWTLTQESTAGCFDPLFREQCHAEVLFGCHFIVAGWITHLSNKEWIVKVLKGLVMEPPPHVRLHRAAQELHAHLAFLHSPPFHHTCAPSLHPAWLCLQMLISAQDGVQQSICELVKSGSDERAVPGVCLAGSIWSIHWPRDSIRSWQQSGVGNGAASASKSCIYCLKKKLLSPCPLRSQLCFSKRFTHASEKVCDRVTPLPHNIANKRKCSFTF